MPEMMNVNIDWKIRQWKCIKNDKERRWRGTRDCSRKKAKENINKSGALNGVESSELLTSDQKQSSLPLMLLQIYWKLFYLLILAWGESSFSVNEHIMQLVCVLVNQAGPLLCTSVIHNYFCTPALHRVAQLMWKHINHIVVMRGKKTIK